MPRVNLYRVLGGLSPQEVRSAAQRRQAEQTLKSLADEYKYAEERSLREATKEFANDPYGFSLMMFEEYSAMADRLDEAIEMLGEDASLTMKRTRDKFREEANKYWAVISSLDGIASAKAKNDVEKERYYQTRLSAYAVVYDAEPTGEIKNMRIESVASLPEKSKPTNIGFLPLGIDNEGTPIIGADDADKIGGIRVYIRGVDPNLTPQTRLGGFVLEWDTTRWVAKAAGGKGIDWDYGIQRIRRASFINKPPGSVVSDSKGRLWYVNYDGSLAYIKSKKTLDFLGIDYDQIYPLDPFEEEYIPPEDKISEIKPDPLIDLKNKYEQEAEETLRSGPGGFLTALGALGEKIAGLRIPLYPGIELRPFAGIPQIPIRAGFERRKAAERAAATPPQYITQTGETVSPGSTSSQQERLTVREEGGKILPPEDTMWRRGAEKFLKKIDVGL